jgi:hypothetical protein
MMRVVIWGQIFIVLTCVGYSTYSLFRGHFDQALLPYPLLILYYLICNRNRIKRSSSSQDHTERNP